VKFDLQTVHHDDLLRKLHERETDIAIAYQVPPSAPIAQRWVGEGELVVRSEGLTRVQWEQATAELRAVLGEPTRQAIEAEQHAHHVHVDQQVRRGT